MPRKPRWPRTHYVGIPETFWKGLDRQKFSETKKEAFDFGDLLAPLEVFVIHEACGEPVPAWANEYIAFCFYRFLKSKGRVNLGKAFGLANKRQWQQRKFSDQYRELTGEMYKLICLGIDRHQAAKAVSAVRTDLTPPSPASLEQMYYRDGWAKLWARYYESSDAQDFIQKQKKALLNKYRLT